MAMILAREFELITLWVRLAAQRGEPAITVRLEGTVDGEREVIFDAGPYPASEFGLPSAGVSLGTATLGVAPQLVRQLAGWSEAENPDARPIWLCLVQPYGHLGMIPWEADLVPALNVPVLRLPDFLEPRRESASTLDVAVVSSVPRGVGKGEIGSSELRDIVDALLQSTTERRVQVHVFADESAIGSLAAAGDAVKIYAPPAKSRRRPERNLNPWFEWIEDAMQGQALDAVHFLAHGVLGASGGMLALGAAPGDKTATGGVYSNATQVSEFLTRIGAWSAGFHLPNRRETDLGLRQVADAIGALRPGSLLYHDALADHEALGPAMKFLYGPDPQPAPRSPGLFAFIQPRHVLGAGGGRERRSIRGNTTRAWGRDIPDAYDSLFDQPSVPSYVAATERICDQAMVTLNKGIDTPNGNPLGAEESEAITRAMGALKSVVANYAVDSQTKTRTRLARKGSRR